MKFKGPCAITCPQACAVPEGVTMHTVPRPRHAWSDVVLCPHDGCGLTFLVTKDGQPVTPECVNLGAHVGTLESDKCVYCGQRMRELDEPPSPVGQREVLDGTTAGEVWAWHLIDRPDCDCSTLNWSFAGYVCPACGWEVLS